MATGNRELDSLVRELELRRLEGLGASDGHRLGHIERLMRAGLGEMQQAHSLLEELVRELEAQWAPEPAAQEG